MTEIEELLIKISQVKAERWPHISVDCYYNDLEENFVVKITDHFEAANNKHFRNERLSDSLLDCYNYLTLISGF
jgi:hypothetical protein